MPTPSAGSRSPGAAHGSHARAPRSARALLLSDPAENPGHVRPAAPSGAVSRPSSRSSRQSSGSPPIARRARLGGPGPSEPRGHGPQGNTEELASSSLHPLKSWSLRQTRCGSIRAALHRLDLSWKKAKKLLGRADPAKRQAFIGQVPALLAGAQRDRYLLVYWDEAHIHQDADLGYGWSPRGQRFWVTSHSPGLSAKLSFYGLYLYTEGVVRLWPYPCANGAHTIEALRRLRAEWPDGPLIVLWDGAPYHRAAGVRDAAAALGIEIIPLPGYSAHSGEDDQPFRPKVITDSGDRDHAVSRTARPGVTVAARRTADVSIGCIRMVGPVKATADRPRSPWRGPARVA